jgi:hypothetical protein
MIKEQALKTFKHADMEELSGDEDAEKSNGEGVVKSSFKASNGWIQSFLIRHDFPTEFRQQCVLKAIRSL